MDTPDFEWAVLVYQDMFPVRSFGAWKREVEGLIGRLLGPVEAVTMFEMADKGHRLGGRIT